MNSILVEEEEEQFISLSVLDEIDVVDKPLNSNEVEEIDTSKWKELRRLQPLKPYRLHRIHSLAWIKVFITMIDLAQRTTTFSLDAMKANRGKNQETLSIAIEFIQPNEPISTLLLITMSELPRPHCPGYRRIHKLFNIIFHPSKKILTWANDCTSLSRLVRYKYLQRKQIARLNNIDLQSPFSQWHHQRYLRDSFFRWCSIGEDDFVVFKCPDKLCKPTDGQWTLDQAIHCVFGEAFNYASKEYDQPNSKRHLTASNKKKNSFCVQHCLAITKLAMVVELDWKPEQIEQFQRYHQSRSILLF